MSDWTASRSTSFWQGFSSTFGSTSNPYDWPGRGGLTFFGSGSGARNSNSVIAARTNPGPRWPAHAQSKKIDEKHTHGLNPPSVIIGPSTPIILPRLRDDEKRRGELSYSPSVAHGLRLSR